MDEHQQLADEIQDAVRHYNSLAVRAMRSGLDVSVEVLNESMHQSGSADRLSVTVRRRL